MRKRRIAELWLCTGGIFAAGLAASASAQTVTGNLSTSGVTYGSPLAVQTVNTGFGDSNYTATPNGPDANGSELDAAYGTSANGYLYVFLAGDFQNTGNLCNVFIDDGRANGQNTLNAPGGAGNLQTMKGSMFSPGFNATYALEINDYQGTAYTDEFNLLPGGAGNYAGATPLTAGVGANQNLLGGVKLGFNNTNTLGVVGDGGTGSAADPVAAGAVTTGMEIGIPLSLLGNPTGNILVMADINGGGDSYLSNQFLPGLPVGTTDLGGGGTYSGGGGVFNFSTLNSNWFTVAAPLTNGIFTNAAGGSWGTSSNWSNSYVPGVIGDTASFSSATGPVTVTLDGNRTVSAVTINSSGTYTIGAGSSGSLVFDAGGAAATAVLTDFSGDHFVTAPLILNSTLAVTVVSNGNTLNLSGNISGVGGLNVADLGVNGRLNSVSDVILGGSNTYTGGTTITKGTLQLDSANALPANTNLVMLGTDSPGAALDINGFNVSLAGITATPGSGGSTQIVNTNTTSGTAVFTFAGTSANPTSYPGAISDNSATGGNATELNVIGGATLTLTGNNTYAGGTVVASGASLTIASSSGSGTAIAGGSNVTNNGAFSISNDFVLLGNVTGSGSTTVGDGSSLTVTNLTQGAFVNDGSTEIFGSGVAGPISDDGAGILIVDSSLQLAGGSGASQITYLSQSGGSQVDLNGNNLTVSDFLNSSSATMTNFGSSGATLFFAGNSTTGLAGEYDGNITNGQLILAGLHPGAGVSSARQTAVHVSTGQLTLTGSNTYSGGTVVDTGASLNLNNSGTSYPTASKLVNNGTTTVNTSGVVFGQVSGLGSLVINGTAQLAASTTGTAVQGALTINSGSALDVTNNNVLIEYAASGNSDPVATIFSYLSDGYHAGWSGGEIQSSAVAGLNASQSSIIYSIGYADGADGVTSVPSGEVEIMPTIAGDAKLQGNVNFGDFQLLAANFGLSAGWDGGNFTYGSVVNFGDFQLLAQDFGDNASGLASSELASLNSFAAEFGDKLAANPSGGFSLVAVPEPASIGLLGLAGVSLLGRRRRK